MRRIGFLLLALGIVSSVMHFMDLELRVLRWINTWGEGAAWGIRGGFVALGLGLFALGKPKPETK
ncbi:MAG: hypothetical protein JNK49_16960 [Planctomycetes bacterium]|nr:hypothetical protein [Planctomycetota bacterium]